MADLLTIEDLNVDISVETGTLHAVRDLSLTVRAGETLSIVGESGSGKSLTALSIMGLLPSNARRRARQVMFDGVDLNAVSARDMEDLRGRRIGMIFQDPMTALNPTYRIGEQMEEIHVRHMRKGRAAARARAIELLGRVGISGPERRLQQFPHQLSGGLRQRVMIAMTLMCEPALILADEPTTALDVTIQAQVLRLLRSLQRELGLGLLLITHDLGVVAAAADRVAVMYAGQIVETGDVRDVFTAPSHPYTRGLFACAPRLGGAHHMRLGMIPGYLPSNIGPSVGCAFAERCTEAVTACRSAPPPYVALTASHASRCVHAQPVADPAPARLEVA